MIVKVNYEQLRDVENKVEKNCNSLDEEIKKILKAIEDLKKIWQGSDAEMFYKSAEEYIGRMKVLPAFQSTLSNFMKESSNQYENNDKEFSNTLRKEKDEIEQDSDFRLEPVQSDN